VRRLSGLILFALAGCSLTPSPYWHVSRAAAPVKGEERHTCEGGGTCPEGWACSRFGCSWCGPGDTRCTAGND